MRSMITALGERQLERDNITWRMFEKVVWPTHSWRQVFQTRSFRLKMPGISSAVLRKCEIPLRAGNPKPPGWQPPKGGDPPSRPQPFRILRPPRHSLGVPPRAFMLDPQRLARAGGCAGG